jgi:hypothetical protein
MEMTRSNIAMQYQQITMTKGDTVAFNAEILDQNGDVVVVDSADFICKKKYEDNDSIFHKSLNAGIQQAEGLLTVRIAPQDTQEVDAGLYFYDFSIGVGQDRYTIMKGVFTIEANCLF